MTRREFLKQLREALENELSGSIVKENVDYYDRYITEEISKGRSEQDVLDMLGDPWALARTVIDSTGSSGTEYHNGGSAYKPSGARRERNQSVYRSGPTPWWRILLLGMAVIGVLIVVFMVITGIVGLLMPVLIPLIIVMILIRIFSRR